MPNKNDSSCFGFVLQDINKNRFRPYYSIILMVIKWSTVLLITLDRRLLTQDLYMKILVSDGLRKWIVLKFKSGWSKGPMA